MRELPCSGRAECDSLNLTTCDRRARKGGNGAERCPIFTSHVGVASGGPRSLQPCAPAWGIAARKARRSAQTVARYLGNKLNTRSLSKVLTPVA
jgi:hypothetical protein